MYIAINQSVAPRRGFSSALFHPFASRQSGFTLVELAIVLVIIGLLLAMAMKGKTLIDSAKLKSTMNSVNKIEAALAGYYEKYEKLPGDANADGIIHRDEAENAITDLANAGLLSNVDFKAKAMNGDWRFHHCKINASSQFSDGTANTCIYPVVSVAGVSANTTNGSRRGNPWAWCHFEAKLDDSNTIDGTIRQWYGDRPSGLPTDGTAWTTEQCELLSKSSDGKLEMIQVW